MAAGSVQIKGDGARWRELARTHEYGAALVYYPAGVAHPMHEHDCAQASFLLTGGFKEDGDGLAATPVTGMQGYKPAGASHRCQFGRDGALILSVNFREGVDPDLPFLGFARGGGDRRSLLALLLAQAASTQDVVDDLLATLDMGETRGARPGWLRRAAEQFADDPLSEVGDVAAAHGIHRVQLSRAFQRHFGVSPSRYRLHCKAARAVRLMVEDGEAPASAAVAAGFADQAHFTRTAKSLAGIGPGRLRRLLAA